MCVGRNDAPHSFLLRTAGRAFRTRRALAFVVRAFAHVADEFGAGNLLAGLDNGEDFALAQEPDEPIGALLEIGHPIDAAFALRAEVTAVIIAGLCVKFDVSARFFEKRSALGIRRLVVHHTDAGLFDAAECADPNFLGGASALLGQRLVAPVQNVGERAQAAQIIETFAIVGGEDAARAPIFAAIEQAEIEVAPSVRLGRRHSSRVSPSFYS